MSDTFANLCFLKTCRNLFLLSVRLTTMREYLQNASVIFACLTFLLMTAPVSASQRFQFSESPVQSDTKKVFFDEQSSGDACSYKYESINFLGTFNAVRESSSSSRTYDLENSPFHERNEVPPCLLAHKQTFNYSTAKVMAKFASLGYCTNTSLFSSWECKRCRDVPEFQLTRIVLNDTWGAIAFVGNYPPLNATIVVIKGTDGHDVKDWIVNLRGILKPMFLDIDFPGYSDILVHEGFSEVWKFALQDEILDAVNELVEKYGAERPVYATGYSSGAAGAQLAAFTFKVLLDLPDIRLYTFGSPRIGNIEFARVLPKMTTEIWRFTHDRDIIPSLPKMKLGYWHTPQEIFQQEKEFDKNDPTFIYRDDVSSYKLCDGSGEDSSCHNARCSDELGCSSVFEHYEYLSTVMCGVSEIC